MQQSFVFTTRRCLHFFCGSHARAAYYRCAICVGAGSPRERHDADFPLASPQQVVTWPASSKLGFVTSAPAAQPPEFRLRVAIAQLRQSSFFVATGE